MKRIVMFCTGLLLTCSLAGCCSGYGACCPPYGGCPGGACGASAGGYPTAFAPGYGGYGQSAFAPAGPQTTMIEQVPTF